MNSFLNYGQNSIFNNIDHYITSHHFSEFRRYCHFLEDIIIKDEASILDEHGFQLDKVVVLFRHGDRAPLRFVKSLDQLTCDRNYLTHDSTEAQFYRKLVELFIQNRSSLLQMNVPSDFIDFPDEKCTIGQLTKFGLSQHVKLGYLLSETYSTKLGLTTNSNFVNSLKVSCTKFPRTFQSVFALLHGFTSQLGGNIFDNIPKVIFTSSTYFCNESSKFCSLKCATLDKLYNQLNMANLLEPHELHPAKEMVFNLARIISPNSVHQSSYKSLVSVFDAMTAYVCHHEKLPCHSDHGCVSESHAKNLTSHLCLLGNRLQASQAYLHSSWLKMYGFLNDLSTEIRHGTDKVVLFSGHDITIEPLKAIFALPDCTIPRYASRIIFEIYSKKNVFEHSEQYLRIMYDGIDVTKHWHIDKHRVDSNGQIELVHIDHFDTFIRDKFYHLTGTHDYKTACGENENDVKDTESNQDQKRV